MCLFCRFEIIFLAGHNNCFDNCSSLSSCLASIQFKFEFMQSSTPSIREAAEDQTHWPGAFFPSPCQPSSSARAWPPAMPSLLFPPFSVTPQLANRSLTASFSSLPSICPKLAKPRLLFFSSSSLFFILISLQTLHNLIN